MLVPRFMIGDYVVLGVQQEALRLYPPKRDWPEKAVPTLWRVVLVHVEHCSGGEQTHYHCRGATAGGSVTRDLFSFNEAELELAPAGPAGGEGPGPG